MAVRQVASMDPPAVALAEKYLDSLPYHGPASLAPAGEAREVNPRLMHCGHDKLGMRVTHGVSWCKWCSLGL